MSAILLSWGHQTGFVLRGREVPSVGWRLAFEQDGTLAACRAGTAGDAEAPGQRHGQGSRAMSWARLKIGPRSLRAGSVSTFSNACRDSCSPWLLGRGCPPGKASGAGAQRWPPAWARSVALGLAIPIPWKTSFPICLASFLSQAAVTEPLLSQETSAELLGSRELKSLFTPGREGGWEGELPGRALPRLM